MNLEWLLFEFVSLVYIKATLILCLGWAAASLLRRYAAGARYFVWSTTLVLLGLLVPLSAFLPGFAVQVIDPPGYTSLPDPDTASFDGAGVAARSVAETLGLEITDGERDLGPLELVWAALAAIWVVGAIVLLAKLLADLFGLALMSRQGAPAPQEWQPIIARARLDSGCPMPVRVRMSGHVGSPLIWGVLQPTILLPERAAQWGTERRYTVLLHEMLHARRRDHLLMIVAQLVRCVYWANPLVWIAAHKHGVERELSCDEGVVGAGKDRFEYARELVAITRDLRREKRYASVAMTQQQGLRSRVQTLVQEALAPRGMPRALMRAVAAVALVAATTIAAARLVTPPDSESLEARVQALFGRDQYAADQAAKDLGEMGDQRAVPYLLRAARQYPVPHTRMQAILALGKLKDGASIETLINTLLFDADYGIRYAVVTAIEGIDKPYVHDALWRSYETDARQGIRLRAWRALIGAGQVDDPMPILERMQAEDDSEREAAVWHAGAICKNPSVVAWLVREDLGSGYCVWRLRDAAYDSHPDVRAAAVRSLKRIDSPASLELLEQLADTEEFVDVREMARASLSEG